MEIIISARRSGKTTKMVEWLIENEDRILIVFGYKECMRVREFFINQSPLRISEEEASRIVSFAEYRNQGMSGMEIGIDNADIVLQGLFHQPITKITMSEKSDARY